MLGSIRLFFFFSNINLPRNGMRSKQKMILRQSISGRPGGRREQNGNIEIIHRCRCQINIRKFHNFICQWIVSVSKETHGSRARAECNRFGCRVFFAQNATELKAGKMPWTSFNVCHLANTKYQCSGRIELNRSRDSIHGALHHVRRGRCASFTNCCSSNLNYNLFYYISE